MGGANDVFLDEINDPNTGFINITTWQIVEWLLVWYGKITAADLQENKRRLNEPLDTSQPVTVYFKKIKKAVQ